MALFPLDFLKIHKIRGPRKTFLMLMPRAGHGQTPSGSPNLENSLAARMEPRPEDDVLIR